MEVVRRPPFGASSRVGERGASTQRKILEAALDVFDERGFHNASVELITEAAGCSRPSFYQYFSSREDVFWTLARHVADTMGEIADAMVGISPDDSGVTQIEGCLDRLIDLQSAYAPVFTAFPAASRKPAAREGSRRIAEGVGEAILRSLHGANGSAEASALAATSVTILLGTIHYWRLGLGQIPRQRFVHEFAQTFHRFLFGSVPGVNMTPATVLPAPRVPEWPTYPQSSRREEPLRERGRKTRESILEAGSVVLPRRGYHDTRVSDIAAEAGVSHGSFYRYFDNKGELFQTLVEQAASTMVDLVATFPDPVGVDELHDWLEGYFASYRDNGGVISVWQEISSGDPELDAFSLDIALVVFDRLGRIIHQRGFGDVDVDALALLAVVERVPYSAHVLGHVDASTAVDASVFFIRRGFFGLESG